jgi:hypothetical protein
MKPCLKQAFKRPRQARDNLFQIEKYGIKDYKLSAASSGYDHGLMKVLIIDGGEFEKPIELLES